MSTQVAHNLNQQEEARQGLFRSQAVEKQKDRLMGEVLVIPPLSYSLITLFLSAFVLALLVYLALGSYARKETVPGYLVPSAGVIKVSTPSSGIARQVLVEEGDWVEEGQALMVINGDRILTNGDHLEDLLLNEYHTKKALLEAQLQRLPQLFDQKDQELVLQQTATEQDLLLLESQADMLRERLAMVSQQVSNAKSLLTKNLIAHSELEALQEKQLGLQSQLQELERSALNQRNSLAALGIQANALPLEQGNQRDQLQAALSDIAQQIAQLHGQRAFIIKANKSGRVSNLQIRQGQEAQAGVPLLSLVPENSRLQVELLVPARAIGFVAAGQSLKIRYSAFSYQKFGLYEAEISDISDNVLLPNELLDNPIPVQEPMYRVRAELDKQTVDAFGKQMPLKSGITLEADIKLAERSLLEWLMEPVLSLKGRL